MSDIEKRLRASLKFDAINGDREERAICASQMREAAAEIERLRTELSELRTKAEEQAASVPDVLFDGYSVMQELTPQAKRTTSSEQVSWVLDAVVRLIRKQGAPKSNDKYTFVFPDASMTKIRYIFVDGEMVYENLESEQ